MSVSIYYNAVRDNPLTDEENNSIEKIVEKYNIEKPKKLKNGEDFCIYDYDTEEPEVIFSGATKLPLSIINPILTVSACMYWAECLTEIRNIVKDAAWSVQMDEDELIWDEVKGWHLP